MRTTGWVFALGALVAGCGGYSEELAEEGLLDRLEAQDSAALRSHSGSSEVARTSVEVAGPRPVDRNAHSLQEIVAEAPEPEGQTAEQAATAVSPVTPVPAALAAPCQVEGVQAEVVEASGLRAVVTGLEENGVATLTLGAVSDAYLRELHVAGSGQYEFSDVPSGCYYLRFSTPGAVAPGTRLLDIRGEGEASSAPTQVNQPDWHRLEVNVNPGGPGENESSYHWAADVSRAGYQTDFMPRPPLQLTDLGQVVDVVDLRAGDTLVHDYGVHLVSGDSLFQLHEADSSAAGHQLGAWTDELAHRLLETLRSIPQPVRSAGQPALAVPSVWRLTSESLVDDIEVQFDAEGQHRVLISREAFVHAAAREARLDGDRGTFQSQRLYRAALRYVTAQGTDRRAIDRIFQEKHAVRLLSPEPPDASGAVSNCSAFAELTRTEEDCSRFQPFGAEELLEVLSQWALFPPGLQSNAHLQTLVRRGNGLLHPRYPDAPAVAWCDPSRGYIEFSEAAFTGDPDSMHRLLLHEAAHCTFSTLGESLRQGWADVGQWYPDDQGQFTLTEQTVQFVSAYAHDKDYGEDFAESVAYYVLNPQALRVRAPDKFDFLRDYVMSGTRYVTLFDDSATFEVLNLWPDYSFPGKINGVDLRVQGGPEEDKLVHLTVQLHTPPNASDSGGASVGHVRIHSPEGTFEETWLHPVDGDSSRLQGSLTISKYAPSGCWIASAIHTWDAVGNARFEGREDFGWRLCVDNPLADSRPPEYAANSLSLSVQPAAVESGQASTDQVVTAQFAIDEDVAMDPNCVYASLAHEDPSVRAMESWGRYDEESGVATVQFTLSEFAVSGVWSVPMLMFCDAAGQFTRHYFGGPGEPERQAVVVQTASEDVQPPELALHSGFDAHGDFDGLSVSALPTVPEAPNGETLVTIRYYARDNRSGLGRVSYRLLDPQGGSHHGYHYHDNFYSSVFQGDAEAWQLYELTVLLPPGSAPGTWGVQELTLCDKSNNCDSGQFTDTLVFTPSAL